MSGLRADSAWLLRRLRTASPYDLRRLHTPLHGACTDPVHGRIGTAPEQPDSFPAERLVRPASDIPPFQIALRQGMAQKHDLSHP